MWLRLREARVTRSIDQGIHVRFIGPGGLVDAVRLAGRSPISEAYVREFQMAPVGKEQQRVSTDMYSLVEQAAFDELPPSVRRFFQQRSDSELMLWLHARWKTLVDGQPPEVHGELEEMLLAEAADGWKRRRAREQ